MKYGGKAINYLKNNALNNTAATVALGSKVTGKITDVLKGQIIKNQSHVINATAKTSEVTRDVIDRTKLGANVLITLCSSAGGCRRPDYITCSGSAAMTGGSVSVNLYSGRVFVGGGADAGMLYKNVTQALINSPTQDINKISQVLGGNCSLGYIFNKIGSDVSATNSFLAGGATGAGITLKNFRLGVSNPIDKHWLSITSSKAIEIDLSSNKYDLDGGITISTPVNLGK